MTEVIRCEECGEVLRREQARHRVSVGNHALFFHTSLSDQHCHDAAMSLYRRRKGTIRYIFDKDRR